MDKSYVLIGIIGFAAFVCAMFIVDAILGFMRAAKGIDEEAVERRLSASSSAGTVSGLLKQKRESNRFERYIGPVTGWFDRLLLQSGTSLSKSSVFVMMGVISAFATVVFLIALPLKVKYLSLPIGIVFGLAIVLMLLASWRSSRVRRFEEQLPDAIDLVVRSLRVGHPLSAALGIIAEEMQSPIKDEFKIADGKASYGLSVPDAFREMFDRVPVTDIGYLVAVLQIQEETGGNLVESLTKLAEVIRERFRMFKKVKAITVEGRMSAWILSFFPVIITVILRLIKPDYFAPLIESPNFVKFVVVVVAFLIINVLMMMKITKIRV